MEKVMSEEQIELIKQSQSDKEFASKLLHEFKADLEKNEGVVNNVCFDITTEEHYGNSAGNGKLEFEKYTHRLSFYIVRSLSHVAENELDEEYRKEAMAGVERILLHLKREDVLYDRVDMKLSYGTHEQQSIHSNDITKKYHFSIQTANTKN